MERNSAYYQQVKLLVQLLAFVDQEACFALRGGTAINLFVRDFPRLSVDIDLSYILTKARDEALNDIKQALDRMAMRITEDLPGTAVHKSYEDKADALRLVVSRGGVQVKIELSPVIRGAVYPVIRRTVVEAVEDEFGFAEVSILSLADLYAGKICAALDRQHPRDLFDIKLLLDSQGFDNATRKAFIIYLISHSRPIVELLAPHLQPIEVLFATEFKGMAFIDVSLEELEDCRARIIKLVNQSLTDNERQFLLSFQNKNPDWSLLDLSDVSELPAVKWKMINLKKMNEDRHRTDTRKLSRVLDDF
jgi:predicted nucleotidyltransferase component of viral defense system